MPTPQQVRKPTLADWTREAPQRTDADTLPSWILRTANFTVVVSPLDGEGILARTDNPDEYMLVVPPGVDVELEARDERTSTDGDTLFIVPPGASRATLRGRGCITRVFSRDAADIAALAGNHADYVAPPTDLPPFMPWPAPPGGWRLRHYRLADYSGAANIARIFRSTKLMLNVMDVYDAPRDPARLKPHWHDDCEQITLALAGRFVHHLRTPWDVNSAHWRPDAHIEIGSPSALVIPPRLVHTTQAMEVGCWLIDVFGPPRLDFSLQGLVRNADDYPMPAGA